jgi:hypothetical protein
MTANLDARNLYDAYWGPNAMQGLVAEKKAARAWEVMRGRLPATANGQPVVTEPKEREEWCALRTETQQFELDAATWYGTLERSRDNGKKQMLQRLFGILHYGGLAFKRDGGWNYWFSSNMPIATALSHGGRILIQTPVDDDATPDSLWNWLWGGLSAQANRRAAATHDAKPAKPPERILRHLDKCWTETNPALGGASGIHFGVNIAAGGDGGINPISGNISTDDGEHGHLYLCHKAATGGKTGAILVGCEDSAPTDRYTGTHTAWYKSKFGPVPYKGRAAYGQTGHAHTLGEAGKFSVTGGKKWAQLGQGPQKSCDCVFVDAGAWKGRIRARMATFASAAVGKGGEGYM